ncbi:MAG: thioredoxin [Bacteroidetes bacterium]|nr:thioredoxin [Bacteroidota bacterium]
MSEFQQLMQGERPVVLDLFAEWCGPCKAMRPILQELKHRVGDKAVVLKVDVDRNPAIARTYGVQALPTLLILKQGQVVWRRTGVVDAGQLHQALQPFL